MRAEDGTRTRYLQLGKLSLYQVSYFRFSLNNNEVKISRVCKIISYFLFFVDYSSLHY